tara:strand:+ start:417 stop:833 length:417 start_codon:yes stop_codon:yes gene_type:complete
MDVVIAGIASGLLFASILISVGCFVVFQMYRNNVIWVVNLFKDTTASKVIYPIIIFLNPTMAILGVIFGFIFILIDSQISIKILGSPNIIYTFVVIGFSLISFIFLYIISPKYWRSFLGIFITFDAIFGWLIPLLSSN